ncbi:hypothetical protein [Streptococcus ruminantium]|uniref:hypothetical protein n=1 Tax=Streptococcus ruminantium TaxID=1917441 RepID=UPI0012DC3C3C|nr:hypothetical protein [Streptococcus ruminantium]
MDINPMILIRRNPVRKDVINFNFDNFEYVKLVNLYETLTNYKDRIIKLFEDEYRKKQNTLFLNFKREVFNEKLNKVIKLSKKSEIQSILYKNKELQEFLYLIDEIQSQEKILEENYSKLLNKSRSEIQKAIKSNQEILNYLLAINASLYHKIKKFTETPVEIQSKKSLKIDGTLYKVISRSAFKTSPFLDVTQVGRAYLNEQVVKDESYYSLSNRHISINYTFLYRLTFFYLENSDLFYKRATFRLPPFSTLKKEDDYFISYVGNIDNQESSKIFKSKEVTAELKTPKELIEFFENKDITDDINLSELEEVLGNLMPPPSVLKLLKKYVQIGLLIPTLSFDEKSDDHFIQSILEISKKYLTDEEFKELEQILINLKNLAVIIVNEDDFEKRYQCRKILDKIINKLNLKFQANLDSTYIFYEDGILENDIPLSKLEVKKHLGGMSTLQKFTIIFDVNIRLQLEIAERFKLVYHEGVENIDSVFFNVLFETSKDMQNYWGDPSYVRKEILSQHVRLLDKLKIMFIEEYNQVIANTDLNEVNLSELITKYVNLIPDRLMNLCDLSSSFFVQFNGDYMIVNDLYDGHEKYKARFMNYFKEYLKNDGDYLKFIDKYYNDQNYLEYTESFGFNGNVKENRLGNTCYTAAVGNSRFMQSNVVNAFEVEDFFIEIDDKFKLVDKDGKNIKICHRGSLIPIAMPGYVSLLLQLFTSGRMMFSYSRLSNHDKLPRLLYNNIVISRKKERLSKIQEELRKQVEETDFTYYKRINLMFAERGWDRTFFVTVDKNLSSKHSNFLMSFKPLYVDVSNPVSLKVFEKDVLRHSDADIFNSLYIEEFLSNESNNVTEYDIEIFKKENE